MDQESSIDSAPQPGSNNTVFIVVGVIVGIVILISIIILVVSLSGSSSSSQGGSILRSTDVPADSDGSINITPLPSTSSSASPANSVDDGVDVVSGVESGIDTAPTVSTPVAPPPPVYAKTDLCIGNNTGHPWRTTLKQGPAGCKTAPWKNLFNFRAYAEQAPGTTRFWWGTSQTPAERSLLLVNPSSPPTADFQQSGEFWAYTSPQPGTIRYCHFDTTYLGPRIMIKKSPNATCKSGNGWTYRGEFWAYPITL